MQMGAVLVGGIELCGPGVRPVSEKMGGHRCFGGHDFLMVYKGGQVHIGVTSTSQSLNHWLPDIVTVALPHPSPTCAQPLHTTQSIPTHQPMSPPSIKCVPQHPPHRGRHPNAGPPTAQSGVKMTVVPWRTTLHRWGVRQKSPSAILGRDKDGQPTKHCYR